VGTLPTLLVVYHFCRIYNGNLHRVVWDLNNLDADDANCFTLNVRVVNPHNKAAQSPTPQAD
jgi:hypothetical protein